MKSVQESRHGFTGPFFEFRHRTRGILSNEGSSVLEASQEKWKSLGVSGRGQGYQHSQDLEAIVAALVPVEIHGPLKDLDDEIGTFIPSPDQLMHRPEPGIPVRASQSLQELRTAGMPAAAEAREESCQCQGSQFASHHGGVPHPVWKSTSPRPPSRRSGPPVMPAPARSPAGPSTQWLSAAVIQTRAQRTRNASAKSSSMAVGADSHDAIQFAGEREGKGPLSARARSRYAAAFLRETSPWRNRSVRVRGPERLSGSAPRTPST
jgi:hypothetical protein